MPIYEYKGYLEQGGTRTGIMDADSPREARLKLRKQKIHVTELRPVDPTRETDRRSRVIAIPRLGGKRRLSDLAMVTRQMATLLGSGIPLVQSLRALIDQVTQKRLQTVFRDIAEKVTQGSSLAEALANHPDYFNDLYVNMVKAGEASGTVDRVLEKLAAYLQAQNRVRSKVAAALAYPIVMLVIGALVVTILMTWVVPRIVEVVKSANKVLPPETQFLIAISSFFRDYWWALILVAFFTMTFIRLAHRTESGRLFFDRLLLNIPVLGELFKKQSVSRFAVSFSTLLKSGLPVLESLTIVKQIVHNKVLENVLGEVHDKILEGADIATPIKRSGVFPPVVGYMIAVGEQSGRLEDLLDRVAQNYDEEIDITTQKLTSVLEPIMIVGLAVVVGFIVLAIIRPILEVGTGVG